MPTGWGGGGGGPNGWPVTFSGLGHQTNSGNNPCVANQVISYGFVLPAQLTFTHLVAYIIAADGTHNSDIGIYNAAGTTLLANIGAQHIGSTGLQAFTIVQTSVTLNPGKYVYALTSAASTLAPNADSGIPVWFVNITGTDSSSGGALPSTITVTPNYVSGSYGWTFALYS